MREVFRKNGDQSARCRQVSQRHPFECTARCPRCRCFTGDPPRDSSLPWFEAPWTPLTCCSSNLRAPSKRRLISSVVLPLHVVHLGFSDLTSSIRRSNCTRAQEESCHRAWCFFLFATSRCTLRLCVKLSFPSQFSTSHPNVRAKFTSSAEGFTVANPTTTRNIQ